MNNVMAVKSSLEQDERPESISHRLCAWMMGVHFFLTPFEMVFTSEIGTLSRYLAIIVVLLMTMDAWKTKKFGVNTAIIPLVAWIFIAVVSSQWALSAMEWQRHVSIYLRHVGFLVAVSHVRLKTTHLGLVTRFLVAGAVLAAVVLLLSPTSDLGLQGRQSIQLLGTRLDPNYLAGVLLVPVLVLVDALRKGNSWWLVKTLFLGLILTATLLTGSRAGFLAVSLGALLVLFCKGARLYLPKHRKSRKYLVWIGVALIALLSFSYLPYELQARFSVHGLMGGDNQGSYRLIIWRHAMQSFYSSPVIGIGVGSFASTMAAVFRYVGAHNVFVLVFVETGIVGAVMFFSFLFLLLKQLATTSNALGVGVLIGTVVLSFFLDSLTAKFFWNGILFSILVLRTMPSPEGSNRIVPLNVAGHCADIALLGGIHTKT